MSWREGRIAARTIQHVQPLGRRSNIYSPFRNLEGRMMYNRIHRRFNICSSKLFTSGAPLIYKWSPLGDLDELARGSDDVEARLEGPEEGGVAFHCLFQGIQTPMARGRST